jgi:hypothetical protein
MGLRSRPEVEIHRTRVACPDAHDWGDCGLAQWAASNNFLVWCGDGNYRGTWAWRTPPALVEGAKALRWWPFRR